MPPLQLQQLRVPPGQRLLIENLDWHDFEQLVVELGENRTSRIAYSNRTLEIRMPTPEHEVDKELIGDLVKLLLEEAGIDCECFGSTTFKRQEMKSGIEPDQCFYIQNHAQMRGKRRVDLAVDPPPDLAIEVDVTSKAQIDAYAGLGVAELWRYEQGDLRIYRLRAGSYEMSAVSLSLPNLPVADLVTQVVQLSATLGRSPALRQIREQVRQML